MGTPPYLIFYVTGKCNAKCSHCFNHSMDSKDLCIGEIRRIAEKWGKLRIINLGGGEPYLREDLPAIVNAFKAPIVAIPSNGIMTQSIIRTIYTLLERFPKRFFRFTFSVDGIGEEHDKIRGVECFNKVSETIRRVAYLKGYFKNFVLLTNTCFMQSNQNTVLNTLKYIKKNFDVDLPSVTYVRGDPREPDVKQDIDINKYKEIVAYLNKLDYSGFKKHPMARFIKNVTLRTREKVIENIETGKKNFRCYAANKMVVVTNTGKVKPCEILPDSLGNLKDYNYDIKNIINSLWSDVIRIGVRNCHSCHWECAIRAGLIYNPKEWIRNLTYKP